MGHSSACTLSTRGSKLWGTVLHVDCVQEGVNYGAQLCCNLWGTALHVDCLQDGVNYGVQLCM
jgi:hypothetical protein